LRGPSIILSRAHPKIVSQLFALEVPEIAAGTVAIKSIAREAGSRSKIAVASTEERVDPIGSMIGQKGTRVQAVINELAGEKIDIIEWSEDPIKFISQALSPAKVIEVKIAGKKNQAEVIVPEDQLSLAIGIRGQNVRLAAKLTGWKIDIVAQKPAKEKPTKKKEKSKEEKKEKKEKKKTKKVKSKKKKEEKAEKKKAKEEEPKKPKKKEKAKKK
jgi:N utilization substance protein A